MDKYDTAEFSNAGRENLSLIVVAFLLPQFRRTVSSIKTKFYFEVTSVATGPIKNGNI